MEIVFLTLLFLAIIVGACQFKANLNKSKVSEKEVIMLEEPIEESEIKAPEIKEFTGEIIEEPFVNKAGRVIPNVGDLFFKTEGKKHFIKLMEGKVLRVDLEKYLNQTIKVKAYLTDGLWDTDNPEMQSRIGVYMVVLEML